MKTNNNIPAYRFQGYTDAWEQRKLVNEVLFIGTGKSKFSALEFGEFEILGSTSVIGYDNSYDYEGDFILTARVGANAGELYRHSGKVKISDNTVFIQGDGLDFIFYILQHFDIKKLSFGTGQPLVKASELKESKIFMPVSVKERNQVGSFFSVLDQLITLHQRKLDTLKEQKKTYLKLLFPAKGQTKPALRFQGFKDDWEKVKLGEIGETFTGLSGKTKEDFGHGEGKFITYVNVFNNPISDLLGTDRIEVDESQTNVQFGDIFFTTSSETPEEVGMSSVWLGNGNNIYLNSFCFGFRPTLKLSNHFMAYVLRSTEIRKKFIFLAQGISRYNISKTKVMN
ncbi:TPA: restriction endonuclease subunit S, partial [Streptococcus suis]